MSTEIEVDEEEVFRILGELQVMFAAALRSGRRHALSSFITALGSASGSFIAMIHAIPADVMPKNDTELDTLEMRRHAQTHGIDPYLEQIKEVYERVLHDEQTPRRPS